MPPGRYPDNHIADSVSVSNLGNSQVQRLVVWELWRRPEDTICLESRDDWNQLL